MEIPFHRYGSVVELIQEIDWNYDIEFEYLGKEYAICPTADGPVIAEAYKELETGRTFKNGKELAENYFIAGKTLSEIVTEINVIAH